MYILAEYLVRGVLSGAIYGLLALPMSLMFATVASIDFAVGAYALIAAAVASSMAGSLGVAAGLAAAVAAAAVSGIIFIVLKRTGRDDHVVYALATFGVATAVGSLVLWHFGTQSFVRDSFSQFWSLGGIRISPQGIVNLFAACVVVAALYGTLYGTNLGRMMRAAASNPRAAELAGIAVEYIQFGTYLVGGFLGGLAGILILYSSGLDFTAPLSLTLSGFAAAILFGIDSPLRCLMGGIAVGIAEAVAAGYTSGIITAMVPYLLVLFVLATTTFGEGGHAGDRP